MIVPNDEMGMLEWAFKGIVGVLFTVGGWMWVMLVRKVEKIDDKAVKVSDDLAAYKTDVARTYAEKPVIERIHDRIDIVQKGVDEIKTILITNFHNNKT